MICHRKNSYLLVCPREEDFFCRLSREYALPAFLLIERNAPRRRARFALYLFFNFGILAEINAYKFSVFYFFLEVVVIFGLHNVFIKKFFGFPEQTFLNVFKS